MVYDEDRRNRDWWRSHYEDEVRNNPLNFDSWFEYIELEESAAVNNYRIRELFQRAVANVPPVPEKLYWRRYVDLWISYAAYVQSLSGDTALSQTRLVYGQCLGLIPHHIFSFAKVWILAADLELQQGNLKGARKVLATAVIVAPKPKIFRTYIDMEMRLGKVNRCRKLYEKYLCWKPDQWDVWVECATFERVLGEIERARAIFELGIQQLDGCDEQVWMKYIEFEISQGEIERTRRLYERRLGHTKHISIYISFAKFEAQVNHSIEDARLVFSRAADFVTFFPGQEDHRTLLKQEWLDVEASFGDLGDVSLVESMLPNKLNKMDFFFNIEKGRLKR